jgi:hypothetical protein
MGHRDKFWLGGSGGDLRNGLKWGKPILSSTAEVSGVINHNCQLGKVLYDERSSTNCFVLHLNRLSAQQRITANLNKLLALNLIPAGTDIRKILLMENEEFQAGNPRNWVIEIKKLVEVPADYQEPAGPEHKNIIELGADGVIRFHDDAQRSLLGEYLRNPSAAIQDTILNG